MKNSIQIAVIDGFVWNEELEKKFSTRIIITHFSIRNERSEKLTRFYTRTGDDGTTPNFLVMTVSKNLILRMGKLGTIDELTAALGMARSLLPDEKLS
jgi:hypothetical protein